MNLFVNSHGLEILFWVSTGLVLYVYVGYPALLWLFARRPIPMEPTSEANLPGVSLLISAFNESSVMEGKIRNALSLDYPSHLLEVIVISDASDDGTDEIVSRFLSHGVRLVRQPTRLGKSSGLNLAVPQAKGAVLVFSDANAMYERDALRQLVKYLKDPRVGYVVGNARYMDSAKQPASAHSEGLYWKLETWMKERESWFGSVVGGDGAIYAIRKELYLPLRPTDINDFLNPLQIILRGYRGVYERAAVCWEEAGDSFEKEFSRKVRIVSRSVNAVFRAWRVLLPWRQPRHWLALVSHKLIRWFVPLFLVSALIISVVLVSHPFYRFLLMIQVAFYGCALVGAAISARRAPPRVFYLPFYFCLVNIASLLGLLKWSRGSLSSTWQTVRQG